MKKYIAGLITGLIIAVSFTTYAAVQLKVVPNPYPIFINNSKANVQGYNINGSTYLKLSDLKTAGLDVKFADSKINIASAVTKPNTNGSPSAEQGYTNKNIDGFKVFQKDGKEYIKYGDVLNFFGGKYIRGYKIGEAAEKLDKPEVCEYDTKYWKAVSIEIININKMASKIAFPYIPCEYIVTDTSGMFSMFITLDNYIKHVQPLINLSIEEIWNKAQ